MKFMPSLAFLLTATVSATAVADNDAVFKPFVVASSAPGDLEEATASAVNALEAAGFEVVGHYSPFAGSNLIVATSDELKAIAATSDRGGYGAAQRISVAENGGEIEVSFVNPLYIQHAYRMEAGMQPVYDALVGALGYSADCGAGNKKMTPRRLAKYNYMPTMEKFDDPLELGEFATHEDAVSAVEDGLAEPGDALSQVYRIDIPGKEQAVFGVGMVMTNADEEDLDSAFQMRIVDFEGCKKSAYFPYEVLVNGSDVEALHMRFRMAVHFPNLSMMGTHGFTKLISSPGAIEDTLKAMLGVK
jgi:hypothetical protein